MKYSHYKYDRDYGWHNSTSSFSEKNKARAISFLKDVVLMIETFLKHNDPILEIYEKMGKIEQLSNELKSKCDLFENNNVISGITNEFKQMKKYIENFKETIDYKHEYAL